jgi:hypothetical protein
MGRDRYAIVCHALCLRMLICSVFLYPVLSCPPQEPSRRYTASIENQTTLNAWRDVSQPPTGMRSVSGWGVTDNYRGLAISLH